MRNVAVPVKLNRENLLRHTPYVDYVDTEIYV
jgi:hypothetical protein